MNIKSSGARPLEHKNNLGKCRKWKLWVNTEEVGRLFRRFTGTYTNANKALKEFEREIGAKILNKDSFIAYAEERVKTRQASGEISPNTINKELRHVNALKRTPLSSMRMDDIKPTDCRKTLSWIREHPQRPDLCHGNVLSNTTMNGFHRFLLQTFQQAVDDELLVRNPMAKIKAPKCDTEEVEALPWDELMGLLNWLDEKPMSGYVMALYLIACNALRRAESVAVIDTEVLPTKMIISKAVKEATGVLGEPKSEAGKRTLPIMPRLASKIEQMRAWKKEKGLADAITLACNIKGGVIRPQNLYRWWVKETEGTDYEGVGLHQLRHSNLTKVARSMSVYDLMAYAGWATIDPARIYIHDDYPSVLRGVCEAWGIQEVDTLRVAA